MKNSLNKSLNMKFFELVMLFAVLSTAYAAPSGPLKAEARDMYGNVADAAQDTTGTLEESGSNLAKAISADVPEERTKTGTIQNRISDFERSVVNNARSITQRMTQRMRSIVAQQKSITGDVGRALNNAQKKSLLRNMEDVMRDMVQLTAEVINNKN